MKHIKGTINDSGFDLHPVFPQLEPNFKSLGERVCCVLQTLGTAHMHRSKKVRDFEMFTADAKRRLPKPQEISPSFANTAAVVSGTYFPATLLDRTHRYGN